MRSLLLVLSFLFSWGLSAQCISVEVTNVDCVTGQGAWISFDIQGMGDSTWQLVGYDLVGSYDTEEIFTVGPVTDVEGVVELFFQDMADPDCAERVVVRLPSGCGSTDICFGFVAAAGSVANCNQDSTERITIEGGNAPYLLELMQGDAVFRVDTLFDGNQFTYNGLNPGTYSVAVFDDNGCRVDVWFNIGSGEGCGSVSGVSWRDQNGDGIRQPDERPVSTRVLAIRGETEVMAVFNTGSNGSYAFNNLPIGTYYIQFDHPNGLEPTRYREGDDPTIDSDLIEGSDGTAPFVLEDGDELTNIDAGWREAACSVTLQGGFLSCGGEEFLLQPSVTGTPPFTYLWSDGSTGANLEAGTPGVYTVTVEDADGCRSEASAQVIMSDDGLEILIEQTGGACDPTGGSIQLTATAFGGVAPYTYEWSNGATMATITEVAVGDVFSVTITDSNGCVGITRHRVNSENNTINWFSPFYLPCGGGSVTISTGDNTDFLEYVWQTPSGGTLGGPEIEATEVGIYTVVGTTPDGVCTVTGEAVVLSSDLPPASDLSIVSIGDSIGCEQENCYRVRGFGNIEREDLRITWTDENGDVIATNGIFEFVCLEVDGVYTIEISNSCGSVNLSAIVGSSECGNLSGTVYVDQAGNCQLDDATDTPIPGILVEIRRVATELVYYAFTNTEGRYAISLPVGDYTVRPVTEPTQPFGACEPLPVYSVGIGPAVEADAFLPALLDCPQMTTSVSMPFLRRCFQNFAYVNYRNVGSAVAENATITVTLDEFFIGVVPSITPSSVDGNTFTFDLGDVPPFGSGQIFFHFTVSCDAELGQSHCLESVVTPNEVCNPSTSWNGAMVNITGIECTGDEIVFTVTNVGENTMSVPLNYVVVEDGIMMTPMPVETPALEPGGTYVVRLPANGTTYQLVTNQEPEAPASDEPTALSEGCGVNPNGTFTTGLANILALGNGVPSEAVVCRANVGAYDPNDKNGYPLGYGAENNIAPGTRLDFAIRFQNTGTDTAFNVVIRDQIAPEFDLKTLRVENASHDFSVSIDTNRWVTFTFADIMLPDSNVNLAGSQGVVTYSIDHDVELQRGAELNNQAGIYFDFNEPIITNETSHRIAKQGLPVGVREVLAQSVTLDVYPNPTDGLLKVSIPVADVRPDDVLTVIDLHGRPVLKTTYARVGQGMNVAELPQGYYLLVLSGADGLAKGRTGFVRR